MNELLTQNTISQSMQSLQANKLNTAAAQSQSAKDEAAPKAAAQDFEAVFISQMLEHMYAGIETDGMFGGGNSEKIYRSMLIEEYGKGIARTGGIGLADALQRQILEMQAGSAQ